MVFLSPPKLSYYQSLFYVGIEVFGIGLWKKCVIGHVYIGPNEAKMHISQVMIGYPLLSQDSLEADWTILENNEKVTSHINIPY